MRRCCNPCVVRVPQLRYRLVVLGSLSGQPAFPGVVRNGISGAAAEFATVGDAISDLPPIRPGGGANRSEYPQPTGPLSQYASEMRRASVGLYNHWAADTDEVNLARIRHVSEGGNWHDIPLDLLPPRFREVRITDHTTTYRRLDRTHPAHTITTECGNVTSGAFTHPLQHRAISVREAARFKASRTDSSLPGREAVSIGKSATPFRRSWHARFPSVFSTETKFGKDGLVASISMSSTRYAGKRLPFTLAPRYKALFGKSVHRRRKDLVAA